jgi:phage portal protein BeeE
LKLRETIRTWWNHRSLENPSKPLYEALGARSSVTGVSVTPENALEATAIWAAVRMISSTVATLPLPVFRHVDGGKERAREHPAYSILHDRPNPEQSSFSFREMMMAHLLLYGDFFAEVERNGRGDAVAMWPLLPMSVAVKRLDGKRVYVVRAGTEEVALSADNVLHVPGFSLDGARGLMPVRMARNAMPSHWPRLLRSSVLPSLATEPRLVAFSRIRASLAKRERTIFASRGISFIAD